MWIVLENHPADSRVKIIENGVFETLTARMGTGGGNVPLVLQVKDKDDELLRPSGIRPVRQGGGTHQH